MSWKLTGHPKTQRITRALAKRFAEMEPAPQDRPLSELRLRVYEKVAKAGGFRPVQWAVCHCRETGQDYRVNGKHTSTLFSTLDPLPELYAVVEVYEASTLADVSKLYATYDSKMQSRTANDIYRSFAACVPMLANVQGTIVNLCCSGIWYGLKQDRYKDVQPAERAEILLERPDFVIWVQKLLGSRPKENDHLRRVPVVGAMYMTYQKSKAAATEFWGKVRDENDVSPAMPTRKLSRYLLTHGRTNRNGVRRILVREREFYCKSLHGWNAWRTNESTNLNYHPGSPVPIIR